MPSTGPIYGFLAAGYESMLRRGLKIPRLIIVLSFGDGRSRLAFISQPGQRPYARHG